MSSKNWTALVALFVLVGVLLSTFFVAGCPSSQKQPANLPVDYDALAAKTEFVPVKTDEDGIYHLADSNFMEVVDEGVVVVDFWMHNCPPCKKLEPIFKSLVKDYQKIRFAKICTDDYQIMPTKYGIRGCPTLVFFVNGEEYGQLPGLPSETQLRHVCNKLILEQLTIENTQQLR